MSLALAVLLMAQPGWAQTASGPGPAPGVASKPGGPAQPPPAIVPGEPVDPSLSPECRVPGSKLYTLAKLGAVKDALAEKRPVRVLSVGSSGAGLGASSLRLENALKRSLGTVEVDVESRGLPGEIASGAAERLQAMLAEVEPDLVVWQVGLNDALARVELDAFGDALDDTVRYVKLHDIDIVLIDPLFTRSMAEDEYYNDLVRRVQAVAQRERVPLVRRYEAMRFLADAEAGKADDHQLGSQFRLNDLGLRCMAEHVARAVSLSLLDAGPAVAGEPSAPRPGNAPANRPAK